MHKLRMEAQKLRDQGYSYSLIQQRLGVAKGTMSYWFKDQPFIPNEIVKKRIEQAGSIGIRRHNEKVKQVSELRRLGAKELGRLTKRELWILGIGLYIGEGAKTNEITRIVNSDPTVIAIAVKWFLECCGLEKENLTIALHIYPDNDEQICIDYWIGITGLERSNFRKTQVDARTNKKASRRGKLPYGTAHVTVVSRGDKNKGVRLNRRINGWMVGALNQL